MGGRRLAASCSVLLSVCLCIPVFWQLVRVPRSPLPASAVAPETAAAAEAAALVEAEVRLLSRGAGGEGAGVCQPRWAQEVERHLEETSRKRRATARPEVVRWTAVQCADSSGSGSSSSGSSSSGSSSSSSSNPGSKGGGRQEQLPEDAPLRVYLVLGDDDAQTLADLAPPECAMSTRTQTCFLADGSAWSVLEAEEGEEGKAAALRLEALERWLVRHLPSATATSNGAVDTGSQMRLSSRYVLDAHILFFDCPRNDSQALVFEQRIAQLLQHFARPVSRVLAGLLISTESACHVRALDEYRLTTARPTAPTPVDASLNVAVHLDDRGGARRAGRLQVQSRLLQDWGPAVLIGRDEREAEEATARIDKLSSLQQLVDWPEHEAWFEVHAHLVQQLRVVFGFGASAFAGADADATHVHFEQDPLSGLSRWELAFWASNQMRALLASAQRSLQSLHALIENTPHLEVPSDIPGTYAAALEHIETALQQTPNSTFPARLRAAQRAWERAEEVYFDHRMVPTLYFTMEHLLSIYLPLWGPLILPILFGFVREVKRWRMKRRQQKPAVDGD